MIFGGIHDYNKFASMIYAYEQGGQDIIKAKARMVFALVRVQRR